MTRAPHILPLLLVTHRNPCPVCAVCCSKNAVRKTPCLLLLAHPAHRSRCGSIHAMTSRASGCRSAHGPGTFFALLGIEPSDSRYRAGRIARDSVVSAMHTCWDSAGGCGLSCWPSAPPRRDSSARQLPRKRPHNTTRPSTFIRWLRAAQGVSGGSRGLQEIVPLWCKPWTTTVEAWLVARLKGMEQHQ